MVSQDVQDEMVWTYPATDLQPGDLLVCPYDRRVVLEVKPFEGAFVSTPNCSVRYMSLSKQNTGEDAYCYLWQHQVIRNGEIVYDANNPPNEPPAVD